MAIDAASGGGLPLPAKGNGPEISKLRGTVRSASMPSDRGAIYHNAFGNSDCTVFIDGAGEVWCCSNKTHAVERLRGL